MPTNAIHHALGLHLHQPSDNLRELLRRDAGEVGRILLCYERIARHAHKYADVARLHVALSPVLLEQLRDPALIDACRHLADIPAILEGLRGAAGIEFVGSGLRHAPLPLIPPEDWDEQLGGERVLMEAALGRVLRGYWPPEGLFVAEMVPALARAGYEYVLLPATALALADGNDADPYRAYRLCHQGARIDVVPWDRGFSESQAFGLEAPWFADEVRNGVARAPASDAPHLLTTWSDGENGEWFRRLDETHGFFGQFFSPYMEFCETGEFPVRPVHLSDYLREHRPRVEATLRAGRAPEAGLDADGLAARERLFRVAARYWSLARPAAGQPAPAPAREAMARARALILRAEESDCLLGDAARREAMRGLLDEAEGLLGGAPEPAGQASANAAEVPPPPPNKPGPAKKKAAPPPAARKRGGKRRS